MLNTCEQLSFEFLRNAQREKMMTVERIATPRTGFDCKQLHWQFSSAVKTL